MVFVFDSIILGKLQSKADQRVTFILHSLQEIDQNLQNYDSSLVVRFGDPTTEIPRLASQLDAQAVVTARDIEPYAVARDERVRKSLVVQGIEFQTVKDQVIFEKCEILSKTGTPFRVFTPFSRAWLDRFEPSQDARLFKPDLSRLVSKAICSSHSIVLTHEAISFESTELWLVPGERAARKALDNFEQKIDQYGAARDFPAINGTSFLSAHLRFGTISVREAVRAACRHGSDGSRKWLTELIWREFYQYLLANNPHVVSQPFKEGCREMQWPGLDEHFDAWKRGVTGYPIIDAAMRCFAATGWMHNRLRMIVASFLTKDLLIDYRHGEAYFASHLLDFDLASNNGGWQWAASVGCDSQPYFRIFNPYLQSQKFDQDGAFIRQWIPELAVLDNQAIHRPSPIDAECCGYPKPIVDHGIQRKLAIAMFRQSKKSPNHTS